MRARLALRFALAAVLAATMGSIPARAQSTDAPVPLFDSASPAPIAPTPSGTSPGGEPAEPDRPAFWDLGGRVREAINEWFRNLVGALLEPGLRLLGRTVLATPDFSGPGRARELWTMALGIADTCFLLFILAGGIVVMGHETVQVRYTMKDIAPRIALGFVAANTSLLVAGVMIRVANALSGALLGQDVGTEAVASTLERLTLGPLASSPAMPLGGGMAVVLVGLAVAVLVLLLVIVWIIRIALVVILVAGAPLLLACHALPSTEGMARMWWRSLVACLAVQVGQAFVLVTALRVFFHPDEPSILSSGASAGDALLDMLVVVCLLALMVRIPVWASRMVFAGRGSATVRAVRYYVVARAARAVMFK